MGGPGDDDPSSSSSSSAAPADIAEEADLLGKPWTYRLDIVHAADLPVFCEMAYVEYDFQGETFTTEAVQQTTFSPRFEYSRVHHVPKVTQKFIDTLKGSFEMRVHVTQHITPPNDRIGTANAIVADSVRSGEPKGYAAGGIDKPKTEIELKNVQLLEALQHAQEENAMLQQRIRELELRVAQLEGSSGGGGQAPLSSLRADLQAAQLTDSVVNA